MRRMNLVLAALLVMLAIAGNIEAQDIDSLWTRTFWNGNYDSANCVLETSDGGLMVAGGSYFPSNEQDLYLIKTDADGIEEWSRHYGNVDDLEVGYHVIETSDGNFLVSGGRYDASAGATGIWMVMTDALGDTLWTYYYNPDNRSCWPRCAVETVDSGFAITGQLYVPGHFSDLLVLKLDRDGNFVSSWTYGDGRYQIGEYIAELPDSGFILAGQYDYGYTTGYDYWALRLTQGGSVVWDSSYVLTNYSDLLYGACLDDDGLVMTGLARGSGHTYKIDLDGNTIWSKPTSIYATSEQCYSVCPTDDGGYMVGGWVSVASHARDFHYIKLDDNGDSLWTYTVGGASDDHSGCVIQTSDGNYVMVGHSSSFYSGGCIYLTKVGTASCCVGDRGNVVLDIDDNCSDMSNQTVDIQDLQMLIEHLFISFVPICCTEEADIAPHPTPDGNVDIADLQRMIEYLFISFVPPVSCP